MGTNVKRLRELITGIDEPLQVAGDAPDAPIASVDYDSRRIANGSLFVAVEGFQSDGHRFVTAAVDAGAAAAVVSRARLPEFAPLAERGVAIIGSDNTRRALSALSAAFYDNPSAGMTVIGVTGTNGKTSITYMLEAIMRAAGRVPGVIGTVNYRWCGRETAAPNTTPESRDLQQLIAEMRDDGVDTLIMEVSSHGLALGRVDHVAFTAAIFTNLTRDHLDFHADFEDYFAAKKRLFTLLGGLPGDRAGIVNVDDDYGRRLARDFAGASYPVLGFGMHDDAAYRVDPASVVNSLEGIAYTLSRPDGGGRIALPLAGRFHVYNSLAAVATAHRLGISFDCIRDALAGIAHIPGRFNTIASRLGFHVVVDYAHTDDALRKLLTSVRELRPRRLITVFGCGGDRDRAKRPLMGRAAAELSDHVIVTSDNPRTEDPARIIEDIRAGIDGRAYEVEPDRARAIAAGIAMASAGDIVVIAGKGHEDYQIVGRAKIHFDDREMARKFIAQREAA